MVRIDVSGATSGVGVDTQKEQNPSPFSPRIPIRSFSEVIGVLFFPNQALRLFFLFLTIICALSNRTRIRRRTVSTRTRDRVLCKYNTQVRGAPYLELSAKQRWPSRHLIIAPRPSPSSTTRGTLVCSRVDWWPDFHLFIYFLYHFLLDSYNYFACHARIITLHLYILLYYTYIRHSAADWTCVKRIHYVYICEYLRWKTNRKKTAQYTLFTGIIIMYIDIHVHYTRGSCSAQVYVYCFYGG